MRASVWQNLFAKKGWLDLENWKIVPARAVRVLVNFAGQGNPSDRDLDWVIETNSDFLVFRPSDKATQYFLWEDIVGVDVHTR